MREPSITDCPVRQPEMPVSVLALPTILGTAPCLNLMGAIGRHAEQRVGEAHLIMARMSALPGYDCTVMDAAWKGVSTRRHAVNTNCVAATRRKLIGAYSRLSRTEYNSEKLGVMMKVAGGAESSWLTIGRSTETKGLHRNVTYISGYDCQQT